MGSGSSVTHHNEFSYISILEEAPDKLGEEDFKNLCGNEFDRSLYISLQKPDGYVDKNELISVASGGEEHELYKLYRSYASDDGTLSQKSFNNLCRDSKLFSKSGGYAISDSSITFEDALPSQSNLANYEAFRNNMLPVIATKKGVQLEDLVRRLSKVELPETKTVIPLEVANHALTPEAAAAQLMLLSGDDDEENEILQKQWRAAVKLQRLERVRIARRKMRMKHELQDCVLDLDPSKDFDTSSSNGNSPREDAIRRLFNKHSTRKEMCQSQFVSLCRETEIISRTFTPLDGKLSFDKSKAMASAPRSGKEYNNGVFYDKRINYKVFREVLIPCLSRDLKISIDDLLNILSLDT